MAFGKMQNASTFDQRAEGLRGIAALNVVLCHYATFFFPVLVAKNYVGVYSGDPDASAVYEILRFPLLNIFITVSLPFSCFLFCLGMC